MDEDTTGNHSETQYEPSLKFEELGTCFGVGVRAVSYHIQKYDNGQLWKCPVRYAYLSNHVICSLLEMNLFHIVSTPCLPIFLFCLLLYFDSTSSSSLSKVLSYLNYHKLMNSRSYGLYQDIQTLTQLSEATSLN